MNNKVAQKAVTVMSAIAMLAGCGKSGGTYSTLADSSSFQQEATYVPKKIDILWVMDNSGSMASSQQNISANFQSFINRFITYKYDFHMAVTTTDAWEKRFDSTSVKSILRSGATIQQGNNVVTTNSGVTIMTGDTPNLTNVFQTDIIQGTLGNGDERAFDSFMQTLQDPHNVAFRRNDAFLAIIVVSDEDDQSSTVSSFYEGSHSNIYANPNLIPLQTFVTFLDSYTGGTTNGRNYSVSNIAVQDTACQTYLSNINQGGQKVNQRYNQLADMTGGTKGSLCDNFGTTLQLISDSIIQLSSSFKLTREPIATSLSVKVNGVVLAQDATNGWTYDATTWTITFHGSGVPAADASVIINFDPKSITL